MWYYGDYCMLYPSQYKYIILESLLVSYRNLLDSHTMLVLW
jgi:hypothetical protein